MTIYDWSTTPATNSSAATGINWAEGQAPSTVNDSARAMMADVATWRNAVGVQGAGRNIAARTNSGTPNTKIDITADAVCVRDTSGSSMVLSTVSGTIDFGTVGANGIDAGSQASSTWYYGWVIAKADGTVALLGSTSAIAPTMPSGYTFKALATAARSDGSTHFIKYRQFGSTVYYEAFQEILAVGSAVVETSVSTASFVPPNATVTLAGFYNFGASSSAGGAVDCTLSLRYVSGSIFWNAELLFQTFAAGAQLQRAGGFQMIIPNVSQNIYYLFLLVSGTSPTINISVMGFKLPMGGE